MKCPRCGIEMRSWVMGAGADEQGNEDILLEMECMNTRCAAYGAKITVSRRVKNSEEEKERLER